MKKQIVLNQEDIRQTIANSFNVDKDKVEIDWDVSKIKDHVSSEFLAIKATVEVPMNDQR